MKKSIFAIATAIIALGATSCKTTQAPDTKYHSATTKTVNSAIYNRASADIQVSDKVITFTYTPTKEEQRAGTASVKAAAVIKALEANGGGDLIVAPQWSVTTHNGQVISVTVKGHVATYVNFHPTTGAEAEVINIIH